MNRLRLQLRPLWVAFFAIAGLFSAAGEASACSAKVSKACCAASASPNCGCCPAGTRHSPLAASERPAVPLQGEAQARIPGNSCECRAQDPAAPGSNKESRSHEEQTDEGRLDSPALASAPGHPSVGSVHRTSLPINPPKSPLYLRVSRLLI